MAPAQGRNVAQCCDDLRRTFFSRDWLKWVTASIPNHSLLFSFPPVFDKWSKVADRNTYVADKRDTRHLIYWIIRTSNQIIKTKFGLTDYTANTDGQATLSSLISLSKLIAEHVSSVPSTILRIFDSALPPVLPLTQLINSSMVVLQMTQKWRRVMPRTKHSSML
jgi:hypothetical protein